MKRTIMDTTKPFKYDFVIDQDDNLAVLGYALVETVKNFQKEHDLTLTLRNTTIEVVPLGNGLRKIILTVRP